MQLFISIACTDLVNGPWSQTNFHNKITQSSDRPYRPFPITKRNINHLHYGNHFFTFFYFCTHYRIFFSNRQDIELFQYVWKHLFKIQELPHPCMMMFQRPRTVVYWRLLLHSGIGHKCIIHYGITLQDKCKIIPFLNFMKPRGKCFMLRD